MLRGTCLCGKVKYEIRGEPRLMYYCHCGICRKANGSAFATNMIVLAEDFLLVSGRELLTAFESSPDKHRYFCSACGSPIYSQAKLTRSIVSVRCGTLETDPILRPSIHAHVASKAPWHRICDELPQAPGAFA